MNDRFEKLLLSELHMAVFEPGDPAALTDEMLCHAMTLNENLTALGFVLTAGDLAEAGTMRTACGHAEARPSPDTQSVRREKRFPCVGLQDSQPGQRHVSPMRGKSPVGRGITTASGSGPTCDVNETKAAPSRFRVHSRTSPSTSSSWTGRAPPRRAFAARMRARASSTRNASSIPRTKTAGKRKPRAPQPHAARKITAAR